MYEQVEKPKENKSRVIANSVAQKKSNLKQGFGFVDNRPETIVQRKLQEMANNSPQAKKAAEFQAMANNSSEQQQPIQKKENNTGLPDNLKSGIENLSGYSMDDVKVHYNSDKPAQLQAHAYVQGTDIHLSSGQEKHLPHEAWHVVQQKQGRVKPTMQMKGKVNVNDDTGLEKEADKMGELAQRKGSQNLKNVIQEKTISSFNNLYPIQRVISLAGFQAATPGSLFKPRTQGGIQQIDNDLATYIGTRTAANALTLINTLTTYIEGKHDADRKTEATDLRTRVQNELNLLVAMGDAHAFLVDGLILQIGGVPFNKLHELAAEVPEAAATQIPAIINEVGLLNIATPNLLLLIGAMGVGSMNVLTDMISKSGGVPQLGNLYNLVNRHPNQGHLAHDLTKEAAGVGGTFNRLAGEVPAYAQAQAGAVPGGLAGAIAVYNNALAAAPLANFTTIVNQAIVAHTAATNLAALLGGVGINNGFLGNIMNNNANGINTLQGIQAGHAAAVPSTAPTSQQIASANALRGMIATSLNNQVNAAIAGGVPVSPALAAEWGNFTAAVGAINTANTRLNNAIVAPTLAPGGVNWAHFLTRHTANHFDFGEIKPDNTQWNVAWGAGAGVQVGAQLIGVINSLTAAENWLLPGIPKPNQPVPMGGTAQIAGLAGVAPNTLNIGQFFPENSPANNNYDHPASTMRAIFKVL